MSLRYEVQDKRKVSPGFSGTANRREFDDWRKEKPAKYLVWLIVLQCDRLVEVLNSRFSLSGLKLGAQKEGQIICPISLGISEIKFAIYPVCLMKVNFEWDRVFIQEDLVFGRK